MEPNRTVWTWLADWFAVRRPTRLVVDGVFIMMLSGLVYILWIIWYGISDSWFITASTTAQKFTSTLLSVMHSGLLYLGVVFVAVGCSRIIAEGRTGAPPDSPPAS